ncbi:iron-sulfur cluster assembly scaffold protein [Mycoplasma sp. NEAQ87857]|uniref:iron-sulfur cluster assembly scaffold protein n=1 Tax=Mycoplasma sp. NEAQ87857 TaxID=2683967 RepID=UPI00131E6E73|nr:iron-sulfur cluster assembly scaffold protein [Mycoplasma sp. NEAQ87857]
MHFNQNQAREIIMNHYINSNNKQSLTNFDTVFSTTCSDKLEITFTNNNNVISDIKFNGHGCAVFIASCDLFIDLVQNKPLAEIKQLASNFIKFINQEPIKDDVIASLGDLWVFYNVKTHLNRVNCASLCAKYFLDLDA